MGNQQQPWMFAEDRFGRRLRKEREDRGMTQSDVARVLEMEHGLKLHPTAIAKMEQRDVERPRAIRLFEAQAIADLFGLTVNEMTSAADSEIELLSREFAQLGARAEQLRAETSQVFEKMRAYAPLMAVPDGQATPALQESRERIIRALAALEETDHARQRKARALLDAVVDSSYGEVPDEVQAALRDFGQGLRRAREVAGLQVRDMADGLASATSIVTFEEMERGDFAELEKADRKSSPAFGHRNLTHSYIRTYARRVGLDPDEQVKQYEQAWGRANPEPKGPFTRRKKHAKEDG